MPKSGPATSLSNCPRIGRRPTRKRRRATTPKFHLFVERTDGNGGSFAIYRGIDLTHINEGVQQIATSSAVVAGELGRRLDWREGTERGATIILSDRKIEGGQIAIVFSAPQKRWNILRKTFRRAIRSFRFDAAPQVAETPTATPDAKPQEEASAAPEAAPSEGLDIASRQEDAATSETTPDAPTDPADFTYKTVEGDGFRLRIPTHWEWSRIQAGGDIEFATQSLDGAIVIRFGVFGQNAADGIEEAFYRFVDAIVETMTDETLTNSTELSGGGAWSFSETYEGTSEDGEPALLEITLADGIDPAVAMAVLIPADPDEDLSDVIDTILDSVEITATTPPVAANEPEPAESAQPEGDTPQPAPTAEAPPAATEAPKPAQESANAQPEAEAPVETPQPEQKPQVAEQDAQDTTAASEPEQAAAEPEKPAQTNAEPATADAGTDADDADKPAPESTQPSDSASLGAPSDSGDSVSFGAGAASSEPAEPTPTIAESSEQPGSANTDTPSQDQSSAPQAAEAAPEKPATESPVVPAAEAPRPEQEPKPEQEVAAVAPTAPQAETETAKPEPRAVPEAYIRKVSEHGFALRVPRGWTIREDRSDAGDSWRLREKAWRRGETPKSLFSFSVTVSKTKETDLDKLYGETVAHFSTNVLKNAVKVAEGTTTFANREMRHADLVGTLDANTDKPYETVLRVFIDKWDDKLVVFTAFAPAGKPKALDMALTARGMVEPLAAE